MLPYFLSLLKDVGISLNLAQFVTRRILGGGDDDLKEIGLDLMSLCREHK